MQFDIGESYAGLVPISSAANETRKLFFWCVHCGKIAFDHAHHRYPGSFPPQILLLQTRLWSGKASELIHAASQAESPLLGSTVAQAAAHSVVSLPRMAPLRGKPAHSLLPKTPIHG